ncbi:putative Soluble calcium-activated nucleotidase 1 [Paratrimastix pyriformis]|uniref:Soluble calcium-activated nucleotidase 1 n=1 Tax=Paratrimastix pyriformis TaxID=342808 RepID=A0ABQ8UVA0_9EUKA|nr:putative Soluble calcium-activated nucleotidase 1 [Paratrimastix pyriformis]
MLPRRRLLAFAATLIFVFFVSLSLLSSRMDNTRTPTTHFSSAPRSFRLGIVSDMDQKSKKGEFLWYSIFKTGTLTRLENGHYDIKWEEQHMLTSALGEKDRAMELSELILYKDHLYACDDRTGIVYEIIEYNSPGQERAPYVVSRYVLTDGNGKSTNKGFKCEWATIKDEKIYFGSIGKEYTNSKTGAVENYNPMWVKVIDQGHVSSEDWRDKYNALRAKVGMLSPGYMIHEAVGWSQYYQRWFFLPRRASKESYNDEADERRGTNMLFAVDPEFREIDVRTVGPPPQPGDESETLGFSSFKFLPDNPDHIVALKTREVGQVIETYITVLSLSGEELMPLTKIDDVKFEGVEFLG